MKGTFYIDSNVFLYPVLYNDMKESETAREILAEIEGKNIQAYTSTLTWDEVSITGKINQKHRKSGKR